MADLEKVIKAFECCVFPVSKGFPYQSHIADKGCEVIECPYRDDCDQLLLDALSLLKAQEPRVITLAELWHMEHKPVYLERKNSRLYTTEPSIVLKTERSYISSLGESYILMRENKIHYKYWACDYNKTWRCWTSRPTDEQREATPWAEPPKEET